MEKQYQACNEYVLREIAGETILVPISMNGSSTHGLITLNETAKFIWEECQQPKTIDAIVNKVNEEYNGIETEMKKEIMEFMTRLIDEGLIKERGV